MGGKCSLQQSRCNTILLATRAALSPVPWDSCLSLNKSRASLNMWISARTQSLFKRLQLHPELMGTPKGPRASPHHPQPKLCLQHMWLHSDLFKWSSHRHIPPHSNPPAQLRELFHLPDQSCAVCIPASLVENANATCGCCRLPG